MSSAFFPSALPSFICSLCGKPGHLLYKQFRDAPTGEQNFTAVLCEVHYREFIPCEWNARIVALREFIAVRKS